MCKENPLFSWRVMYKKGHVSNVDAYLCVVKWSSLQHTKTEVQGKRDQICKKGSSTRQFHALENCILTFKVQTKLKFSHPLTYVGTHYCPNFKTIATLNPKL